VGLAASAVEGLLRLDQRLLERRYPKVEGPLDATSQPWVADLEAGFPEVRRELDALLADGVRFPETSEVVGHDQGNEGRWSTYMLCSYGRWLEVNCARTPVTTELVRAVPNLQIAGFAVLHAGTHLPRHRGPSKSLRYHLGLRIPDPPGTCRIDVGVGTHEWAEGASLLFDDSVEHEAWNTTREDRYVLFVEARWPARGLVGAVDRVAQSVLARAAREIPNRVIELDAALNP
jgi:ornithine lipid ester-linked acyl 2-hydroxylase